MTKANQSPVASDRWLGISKVCDRYDCSSMWVERRLKGDPDFPRPTKFGRERRWRLSDLDAYDRTKVKQATA